MATTVRWRFWIRSSRGTSESQIVKLPRGMSSKQKLEAVESWCSQFPAWNHSDNVVEYGFIRVRN